MSDRGLADTPDDWRGLALRKLAAARTLLDGQHYQEAFEMAGLAIECALKCRIMWRLRLNRWPDQSNRPDLYSHNLRALAVLANLETEFQGLLAINPADPMGLAWLIAKDWRIDIRYAARSFPELRAADMVMALEGEGGLVDWLLTNPN